MPSKPCRRLRVADVDYGPVCPRCAMPKDPQALRCAACYREHLLELERQPRPAKNCERCRRSFTPDRPSRRFCSRLCANARGAGGRPQPQSHPWRKAEALRLAA